MTKVVAIDSDGIFKRITGHSINETNRHTTTIQRFRAYRLPVKDIDSRDVLYGESMHDGLPVEVKEDSFDSNE